MVATLMPQTSTMTMPTIKATSELGILSVILGHANSTTRQVIPTTRACQLKDGRLIVIACTLSIASTVGIPSGKVSPMRSFT